MNALVEAALAKLGIKGTESGQPGKSPTSQAPAAPAGKEPAAQPSQPAEEDLSDWTDDEREELDVAKFAAQAKPERYGAMPTQVKTYKKEVAEYIEAHKNEEDRTFDEHDRDFMAFIDQHRPRYDPGDRNRLQRQMIAAEASAVVEEKVNARLAQLDNDREREKAAKAMAEQIGHFDTSLAAAMMAEIPGRESIIPGLVNKLYREGGEKAREAEPLWAGIVEEELGAARRAAATYLALRQQPAGYKPDDPEHGWIVNFLRAQGNWFKDKGGDKRIRSGPGGEEQTFVPLAEYAKIAEEEPAKLPAVWTWQADDILRLLAINARRVAEHRIRTQQSLLEQAGFKRQAVVNNGQPASQPNQPAAAAGTPSPSRENPQTQQVSPAVVPRPAPGAAEGAKPPPPQTLMTQDELTALGLTSRSTNT